VCHDVPSNASGDRDMNRDMENFRKPAQVVRVAPKALTAIAIASLKPGKVMADGAIRPGNGSLKIRKRQTAATVVTEWLFEWNRAGKAARYTVGRYSPTESEHAFTIGKARLEAARLQAMVEQGLEPTKVRDQASAAAKVKSAASVAVALEVDGGDDFASLLSTYVTHLRQGGKADSAYDAENMFKNHVLQPFPELAHLPAADVVPAHIAKILARLVGPSAERQVGRTALKLRSYLGAAFKLGMGAGLDPMAPIGASKFGLTGNPAGAVPSRAMAAKFNKTGERTLSEAELRIFMVHVFAWPSELQRLALLFQIFSGGQRIRQLLRIRHADVEADKVVLYDPKGRRATARTHALPMTAELREIVDALTVINKPDAAKDGKGFLFASRDAVIAAETLSGVVEDIRDAMLDEQQITTSFRGGDVRRTVETILSGKLKVSKDHRAQLLSHGLTGVQDVVYDKDLHLAAKETALRLWSDYLEDLCQGTVETYRK
jgi:hypothetical protein